MASALASKATAGVFTARRQVREVELSLERNGTSSRGGEGDRLSTFFFPWLDLLSCLSAKEKERDFDRASFFMRMPQALPPFSFLDAFVPLFDQDKDACVNCRGNAVKYSDKIKSNFIAAVVVVRSSTGFTRVASLASISIEHLCFFLRHRLRLALCLPNSLF